MRDFDLDTPRFFDLTFRARRRLSITLDALGLSGMARQFEQAGVAQAIDRLGLDGMLALVAAGSAPVDPKGEGPGALPALRAEPDFDNCHLFFATRRT